MEPTSVLLGVLIASTKGLAFVALGFGIAWWRARTRIAKLEASLPQADELGDRLTQLESSLDYTTNARSASLRGKRRSGGARKKRAKS